MHNDSVEVQTSTRFQSLIHECTALARSKLPGSLVSMKERLFYLLQPPVQTFFPRTTVTVTRPAVSLSVAGNRIFATT
jgi:hypothetical protein